MNRKVELYENQNGSLSTSSGRSLDVVAFDSATESGYKDYSRPRDNFVFGDTPNTIHEKGNVIRINDKAFNTKDKELITKGINNFTNRVGSHKEIGNLVEITGAGGDYQSFPTIVGETYIVETYVKNGTDTQINVKMYGNNVDNYDTSTFITGAEASISNTELTKVSYTFVATHIFSFIYFQVPTNGKIVYYDSNRVSVKKLTSIEFPEAPTANIEGLGIEEVSNPSTSNFSIWNNASAIDEIATDEFRLTNGSSSNGGFNFTLDGLSANTTFKMSAKIKVSNASFGLYLSDPAPTYNNTSYVTQELILVSNNTGEVSFGGKFTGASNGDYAYIKNISIKEVTGLQTQQSYNIGDMICLDRPQLNDDISNDLSKWTYIIGATISNSNGNLAVTNIDSDITYGRVGYQFKPANGNALIAGKRYTFTIAVEGTSFYIQNPHDTDYIFTENTRQTYTFVADGVSDMIMVSANDDNADFTITEFSVRQIDDLYQATRNTADMYDKDDTMVTNINIGEIIYHTGTNVISGTTGHFYKRLNTSLSSRDLSTYDGFDSANFVDLGTAENMSLQNPYFKAQDKVFRYDIAFHRLHKTNKALDTKVFSTFADGVGGWNSYSNDEVAMQEMFDSYTNRVINLNKVAGKTDTYEDSTYFYIMIGEVPRLNQGAYHPIYNALGTIRYARTDSEGSTTGGLSNKWYEFQAVSGQGTVVEHFNKSPNGVLHATTDTSLDTAVGGVNNARPDGKFYDKIYSEGLGGFTDRRIFVSKYSYTDIHVMSEDIKRDRREAKMIECIKRPIKVINVYDSSGWVVTTDELFDQTDLLVGKKVSLLINGSFINVTVSSSFTNGNFRVSEDLTTYAGKSGYCFIPEIFPITNEINIAVSGSITHTDVIGNPSNYPQDWKDRLEEGKTLNINPLLVGQNGETYAEPSFVVPIFSKKLTSIYDRLDYTIANDTFGSQGAFSVDQINNDAVLTLAGLSIGTHLQLFTYQADADPLLESNPKPIKWTKDKAIASTSHSIYKWGGETRVISGKVPVGNGFESKILENSDITYDYICEKDTLNVSLVQDITTVLFKGTDSGDGTKYHVYRYKGPSSVRTLNAQFFDSDPNNWWEDIGLSDSIPTHSAFTLDTNNGVKGFDSIAIEDNDVYLQTTGKELVWDTSVDAWSDSGSLTADDTTNSWNKGVIYKITSDGILNGEYIKALSTTSGTRPFSAFIGFNKDGFPLDTNGDVHTYSLKKWDGTGFGDDKEFNLKSTNENGDIIKTGTFTMRLPFRKES